MSDETDPGELLRRLVMDLDRDLCALPDCPCSAAQARRWVARAEPRCHHENGQCIDPSHQGIGGEADGEWFAEQRRRVAENRRRAAKRS